MNLRTAADLDLVRDDHSYSGLWCWEATLAAFGIEAAAPVRRDRSIVHLRSILEDEGYTVDRELEFRHRPGTALGRYLAAHPTGDWLIATAEHVMALRDGKLTDTHITGTGLRRVRLAYRVTREPSRSAHQAQPAS